MSEPKAYRIIQGDTGGCGAPSYKCDTNANRIEEWSDACEVYDKFEADKVIAEKDKTIALLKDKANYNEYAYKHKSEELADTCRFYEDELRHHKYKRCLAMAKWCEERYNYLTCLEKWQMTDKEYQQIIGDYWDRCHKRWLELAEKFKEAK